MKNPIEWLLDKWFKKYDSKYKELFEKLSADVTDNYKQITASIQVVEQKVIPEIKRFDELLDGILLLCEKTNVEQEGIRVFCESIKADQSTIIENIDKHAKMLRERIEDTNVTARSTNELVKEMHLMLSEFYDRFKKKFPN